MRAALARGAAVLAVVAFAAAACGSSEPDTAPPAPPATASPSAAGTPTPTPSPDGAAALAAFCADLNAFAAAAGPAFDLGALALIDGETPNERRNVSQLVDSIAVHGTLIEPELPADLADDLATVVAAAGAAKAKLASDAAASEAVDLLQTQKVKAARDALVKYRGSC
jgi:hypothetical protein